MINRTIKGKKRFEFEERIERSSWSKSLLPDYTAKYMEEGKKYTVVGNINHQRTSVDNFLVKHHLCIVEKINDQILYVPPLKGKQEHGRPDHYIIFGIEEV
jgi:hypothetical protein